MQHIQQAIIDLCTAYHLDLPTRIEKLPESGGYRQYYRVYFETQTVIATWNDNITENKVFLAFTKHFSQKKLPVPTIIAVSADEQLYLQKDLGSISLLQSLERHGSNKYTYHLFEKSLKALADMQVLGHENFNYENCLTTHEFGKQAILADLLYFKYYFLDTLRKPYDKQALIDDFEALATYLTKTEYRYFMFRDFQSRNIMVQNDDVFFIDYQGGMLGAPQYDVASLLWQAKANLSAEWKASLFHHYITSLEKVLKKSVQQNIFISQYNGYVLIRLLQVLGAYGFRGLFERKAHFLTSIPLALQNLKQFMAHHSVGIITPELDKVLAWLTADEMIEKFTPPQADEQSKLTVTIQSFSYKKGYPKADSKHGGGFVFDCRGILNPGRFDEYKTLSGKDKSVVDFLEQQTRMPEYLNSVWDIIDINIEDYLQRNFDSLVINFGCTGGQHRSVYAAEQTARHLRNKYKLQVAAAHTNQENWNTEIKTTDVK